MSLPFCNPGCEQHGPNEGCYGICGRWKELADAHKQENKNTCTWIRFDDGTYVSNCDHEFYATEDDNLDWMNFCPYCGKSVVPQREAEGEE